MDEALRAKYTEKEIHSGSSVAAPHSITFQVARRRRLADGCAEGQPEIVSRRVWYEIQMYCWHSTGVIDERCGSLPRGLGMHVEGRSHVRTWDTTGTANSVAFAGTTRECIYQWVTAWGPGRRGANLGCTIAGSTATVLGRTA